MINFSCRFWSIAFFVLLGCNQPSNKKDIDINSNIDTTFINAKAYQRDVIVQSFVIDGNKQSFFKTKGGLSFDFPPTLFTDSLGKTYKGKVKILIKEYYKLSEMLLKNLTTISFDKILQTGGMFYISVKDDKGNELLLKKDKSYTILKKAVKNNFKLFYGDSNAINKDLFSINWYLNKGDAVKNVTDSNYSYIRIKEVIKIDGLDTIFTYRDVRTSGITSDENLIKYYAFKMGWMNFDLYYEGETTPIAIKIENVPLKDSLLVLMITENPRSILKLKQKEHNTFYCNNAPVSDSARIVGFVENTNDYYVLNKKIEKQKINEEIFLFAKCSKKELDQLVSKIEW